MKLKLILFCLLSYGFLNAQNCDYSSNVNDSIGSYRSTKDYLMSEKNFGSKKKYLYFSLSNENGSFRDKIGGKLADSIDNSE